LAGAIGVRRACGFGRANGDVGRCSISAVYVVVQGGRAAIPNFRFKTQDASTKKSLPEKQEITMLYYSLKIQCQETC
jgi:hypothetical protein